MEVVKMMILRLSEDLVKPSARSNSQWRVPPKDGSGAAVNKRINMESLYVVKAGSRPNSGGKLFTSIK